SRGGRQNDLLGLSEFCRRHVRDPWGLRREPPPPPQPRFGASAGGAGSPRSPPPGRQHYPSVRRRNPVPSAIIFYASLRSSDPKMPAAPSAVHNCLVGGSSPPSPTTHSSRTEVSRSPTSNPQVAGISRPNTGRAVSGGSEDRAEEMPGSISGPIGL